MTEVVSVKFRQGGTNYYFDPGSLQLREGDRIVVETSKGVELVTVVRGNHPVEDDAVVQPLRPVVRVASKADLAKAETYRQKEHEAAGVFRQKSAAHNLDMKLVDVEYCFDGSRIVFYFSSDGRVDFRELVKDLAGVFHTRIELRQIGVRDEARMLGGLGICGRPFCCGFFLREFQPVSTKMAKTQSMSLNPAKISGACGRLMCCLRYEQDAYEELITGVPKNGAFVETPEGYGNVTQVNVLRQYVKVRLDANGGDVTIKQFSVDEVAAVPGGRPRDGEQPPHVLVLKPKTEEDKKLPEDEEDSWQMPELISSPGEVERRSENARRLETQRESQRSRPAGQPSGNRTRGPRKPAPQIKDPAVEKPEGLLPERPERPVRPAPKPRQPRLPKSEDSKAPQPSRTDSAAAAGNANNANPNAASSAPRPQGQQRRAGQPYRPRNPQRQLRNADTQPSKEGRKDGQQSRPDQTQSLSGQGQHTQHRSPRNKPNYPPRQPGQSNEARNSNRKPKQQGGQKSAAPGQEGGNGNTQGKNSGRRPYRPYRPHSKGPKSGGENGGDAAPKSE